jgi:hypothetical protein
MASRVRQTSGKLYVIVIGKVTASRPARAPNIRQISASIDLCVSGRGNMDCPIPDRCTCGSHPIRPAHGPRHGEERTVRGGAPGQPAVEIMIVREFIRTAARLAGKSLARPQAGGLDKADLGRH